MLLPTWVCAILMDQMAPIRQIPSQGVQGYIELFCKMCLLLHVPDLKEVLILKFVVGLLIQFRREVELFENPTLDKNISKIFRYRK